MKEAVEFMNAYMRRPDAYGPRSPWKDTKFHIYPTQSPEIWPEHFGEAEFSDSIADLAFTKFLFKAYLGACRELGIEQQESALIKDAQEVLANFPEYPTRQSPQGGKVFVDVAGASPDVIYNVPNPLTPVFPGEEYGLHSPKAIVELAANTWRNQQNEGGNDLVFQNLQGARLGLLDLEKFKRQLRYCQMPDGTFTDMTLQAGGRYDDSTANDYMKQLGIWIENFALPVVINESMLQSYTGELRLFPNWSRANGNARFQTLRAVGAFLVSAEYREAKVRWVRITSEAGQRLRIINPWQSSLVVNRAGRRQLMQGEHIELPTRAGETLELTEH
jgi:alpha-L-fucosidase 2